MHSYKRWVIFTASLFLVLAASLVNGLHLYYMAALLLMLPWTSYVLGFLALRGLEFQREAPTTGWEDEVATFHLIVRSKSRLPRLFLQAQDELPRWLQPIEENTLHFNVPPRSEVRVPYRVELRKRGAYRLDRLTVTAFDPLGIFSFTKRVSSVSEIVVLPTPQEMPDMILSGSERHGLLDLPVAALRGSGIDPDGVREYVPGDPLRRMHWKSTARTNKLNVIEFEESHAVNVVLALELHKGSNVGEGKQSTLEYLIRAAASLAQKAIRQGASVRLVAGSGPKGMDVGGRGSDNLYAILTALALAEATDASTLSTHLLRRIGMVPPRTTLVALTSGLDPELPGVLSYYSTSGCRVVVLYADPRSFAPDVRAVSAETQRTFWNDMLASQVLPLCLQRNEERRLLPEVIQDAHFFVAN